MLSGPSEYRHLLDQIAHGKLPDVANGKLVAKSKASIIWNHVYAPDGYAFDTLTAIREQMKDKTAEERVFLKQLADQVYATHRDLRTQHRSPKKSSFIAKISMIFHALTKVKHYSDRGVQKAYNDIARESPGSNTLAAMGAKLDAPTVEALIAQHRKPDPKLQAEYSDKNNLTYAQGKLVQTLFTQAPNSWDLPAGSPEKKLACAFLEDFAMKLCIKEVGDLATGHNKTEILKMAAQNQPARLKEIANKPLKDSLKDLPGNDPITMITEAHLKEVAARMVYRKTLPEKIDRGFYKPAVIASEIQQKLGVHFDFIPPNMRTIADVKQELKRELENIQGTAELTSHQMHYIRHDVFEILNLYTKAYPNKSREQQYILARDVMYAISYQEIFDKGSFTGSDHGSKHVHHNSAAADGLHEHMDHRDYNAKDRFLEHLVHAYHDMGYTVGLAAQNFACCKDHPFIGAKVIEENKDYFVTLLDQDSFEILHDCILCHAIAMPDLTPDATLSGGIHRNLVRAVTSISDACAVTYDRKTQEFWEQPDSLLALTRLRLFLTQYPRYKTTLADPKITQDEWAGLDRKKPIDKLAHDVFQATKNELLKAADSYPLAEDRRELFKQAIQSQFNAFTANVTIGQYGGVLTGVESVRNEDAPFGDPKYLPQFNIAPSIIYGVLKDLFGQDQAQEAFKKLLAEFGGNITDIEKDITQMAEAMEKGIKKPSVVKRSGLALFHIQPVLDVLVPVKERDKAHKKHLTHLQANLRRVTAEVRTLYQKAPLDMQTKFEIIAELQKIRTGDSEMNFNQYLDTLIATEGRLTQEQVLFITEQLIPKRDAFAAALQKCQGSENDEIFTHIQDTMLMTFLSKEEYEFMTKAISEAQTQESLATL